MDIADRSHRDAPYDRLETRDPAEREATLMQALAAQVAHAQRTTAAYAELLREVDASAVVSRAALARLPLTRKADLMERQRQQQQREHDVFGGHSAIGWRRRQGAGGAVKVYQSPGPLYEPEGPGPDYWRMARALWAAGVRAGDLVHNSFSYHLTPAGAMMDSGARALGCTVFPGGVGNTELQLQAMHDLHPDAYAGTPGFLKIVLDKAAEQQQTLPASLCKALVSGEACPPSLRQAFAESGIEAYQCYATAELGLIAYETAARAGLVVDEQVIVEIVRPGTGEPVPEGDVGEVVVTTLNPDHPLIRFATGDLSALLPGRCPSGRTNIRLRGWLGRADQSTKVRGMFVTPTQVADIVRRHPEVRRARLVVSGSPAQDQLSLRVELTPDAGAAPAGLAERLTESLRDLTKLRGEVELLAPGTLPNDGKVIEDLRRQD
ncbi:phenylacetate--CoA ligase family protein [Caldimonas brevitalea]|uniref:AMP-dependent synthetase n=1 Tax=Caldimonas brevitalea TaxID=413882 RepID=A0A0G3BPZ4_9BURK|nr:AMP-binding protein [Caldimonas brevitalea]AKJ31499.1 AMP-dependent synthetase [Caldimonas brevitalea]